MLLKNSPAFLIHLFAEGIGSLKYADYLNIARQLE